MNIASLARALEHARLERKPTDQLTSTSPLTLDAAYRVQAVGVNLRLADGVSVSGAKLGFTGAANARQSGTSDVILGVLISDSEVRAGETLDVEQLIHPQVAAEIAFRVDSDITTTANPRACVDAVAPALEVIDSRYRDLRVTVEDVVADNTSAARYALGPWTAVGDLRVNLAKARIELAINAEPTASGVGADILGDPWGALDAAAELAATYGHRFYAGSVILAGGATELVSLPASGTVVAHVDGLGGARLVTGAGGQ
jgi:2-oxo-3-hexenedioate decarboxylase